MKLVRFAVATSALLASLAVGAPAAFAADAAQTQGQAHEGHARKGHGRGHHGEAHLLKKALELPSLNNAQRAQIESLANEAKTNHAGVKAARAKVMTALAAQVEKGAIDKSALGPALTEETNAIVASRLKERSIEERLHVVLTAAQCAEIGGGKDFLRPAQPEAEVRAHAERHVSGRIDHLAQKVATASPEERANIAARMRAHAAK